MVHTGDGFNHYVRLEKGERLSECLATFWEETGLQGAWVTGLGGVLEVTLGYFYIDTKQYKWKNFAGTREITSLQGNMALGQDGKMIFHLHGVFTDDNFQAVGGHVKDLVAGATVELFIHRTYMPLTRKTDRAVGLQLLQLNEPSA